MSIFWAIFLVVLYFCPAIMAYQAKKKDKSAILALNILLGWTFIGWVIALVWALKKEE